LRTTREHSHFVANLRQVGKRNAQSLATKLETLQMPAQKSGNAATAGDRFKQAVAELQPAIVRRHAPCGRVPGHSIDQDDLR
jgi:hypothetical protein